MFDFAELAVKGAEHIHRLTEALSTLGDHRVVIVGVGPTSGQ